MKAVSRALSFRLPTVMVGAVLATVLASVLSPGAEAAAASRRAPALAVQHHDKSAPLRKLRPAPAKPGEHERKQPPSPLQSPKPSGDGALQTTTSPTTAPGTPPPIQGIGQNFTGPAGVYKDQWYPPDATGDVGLTDYVEIVNTSFAVFDKASGKPIFGAVQTNTLWSGFGGPCETTNDGDATVKYDRAADRWVIQQMSKSSGANLDCLAVSTSNDPTGSWYRYALTGFGDNVPDYPKLGIWPDGYYMTFNQFYNDTQFVGAETCALNRDQLLVGGDIQSVCFTTGYASLLPADVDGNAPPPAGAPNYLLSLSVDHINEWFFHVDWANLAHATFVQMPNIPIAPFTVACNYRCVPQPGTTQKLDTQADRLMYRLVYRNFGDHESLLVSHTAKVGTTIGVRWYEIRDPASPYMYQQGTYSPNSDYRWMGSAAMDQSGDIGIGYSTASSSVYPSLRYTGWTPWDKLGNLESEQILVAGSGSQIGQQRWGDYSSVSIDPSDDCTFWITGEYMAATGKLAWGTAVGTFKFPTCGIPPVAPSTPSLSGSAGNNFANLTWTTPANGGAQLTGYNIYRGDSAGNETLLTSVDPTATSYRDTTVVDFNQYYYRIAATNSAGEGSMSTELALTPTTTAPAGPKLTGTVNRTVNLSWGSPDDGGSAITAYNIYRSNSAGTEALVATVGGSTTSYSDSTNFGTSPAYYQISAVNGVGESVLSNELAFMPSSLALATSVSSTVYGQSVTLTATVTPLAPGSGTPAGSVTFMDGSTVLRTLNLSKGKASYTSTTLKVGTHSISAIYNGSAIFLSSQAALSQTVSQASSSVALSSALNPSSVGQSVTLTAAVTAVAPGGTTPTGAVVFQDGATVLATVNLSSGSAHYNAIFRTSGVHQITATYKGNASFISSSANLTQTVN